MFRSWSNQHTIIFSIKLSQVNGNKTWKDLKSLFIVYITKLSYQCCIKTLHTWQQCCPRLKICNDILGTLPCSPRQTLKISKLWCNWAIHISIFHPNSSHLVLGCDAWWGRIYPLHLPRKSSFNHRYLMIDPANGQASTTNCKLYCKWVCTKDAFHGYEWNKCVGQSFELWVPNSNLQMNPYCQTLIFWFLLMQFRWFISR